MPQIIALVTCVASKAEKPCPAEKMYLGPDFQRYMETARTYHPDRLFILSGKYGLLEPTTIIEPYDVDLNKVSEQQLRSWSDTVLKNLEQVSDLKKDYYVLIASPVYYQYLIQPISRYTIPLKIK